MERKKIFFVDNLKEYCYLDNKYYYAQGRDYEVPFAVEPTEGEHNLQNCENCRGIRERIIKEIQVPFDKFPNCCELHKRLAELPIFDKKDFSNIPILIADKVMYSYHHVINHLDEEDWYENIADYFEYVSESFGSMPTGFGEPFNTLAESRTNKAGQNNVIVNGEGSDLSKIDALKGRAKRKTITQIMMLKLIDVVQKEGEPELEKSYWNTYYCQQNLFTADGRLYGKYCKNRFCTLCCSIRKAEMINKYYPVLKEWKEPYFLTLTVKSCKAQQLPLYIKKFIQGFQRITEKHRKRYHRGKGKKLLGIRSLECNFNPIKKTYNPHFHIITKDKETAEVLLSEWLKLWTPKFAKRPAQNIQKVNNLESGLIEIIKYGSKIFTEPDLKNRKNQKNTAQIYIKALNTILTAMKGKRIFDRFGFNSPKYQTNVQIPAKLLSAYNEWEFDMTSADWINFRTGEKLSGYELPSYLNSILENNINDSSF